MKDEKNIKIGMLLGFIFIVVAIIMFTAYNYHVNKINEKLERISKKDSLNLHIKSFYITHGTMIFNKKYAIPINILKNEKFSIYEDWYKLPNEFMLRKKTNNDTIILRFANFERYVVLAKDIDSIH